MYSITLSVSAPQRDYLIAELWEAGTVGITESEDWIRAFFPDEVERVALAARFRDYDPFVEASEDTDWVQESRKQWTSFPVGERFYLVPEWLEDPAPCGRVRLRVRPGMACGTGAHPATQLCLLGMEKHLREGESVVDVGTGSGILAEAALLLGAGSVVACDIDVDAARVAKQNLCSPAGSIGVFAGSTKSVRTESFGFLVANLNYETLKGLGPELTRVVRPDGQILVAGFRDDEARAVARQIGRVTRAELKQEGWSCLLL